MAYEIIPGGAELRVFHDLVEPVTQDSGLTEMFAAIPTPTPAESALADLSADIYWTEFRADQRRHARQLGTGLFITAQVVAKTIEVTNKAAWKMAEYKVGRYALGAIGLVTADELFKITR